MGVFISWSGRDTKSYAVADALREWLEQVIQGSKPWMSAQDIDAGQRWGTELFSQLDNQSIGIICVTKANQAEPWLNFEAGVLAKQLKGDNLNESRVCPLLIDLDANDVTGPLKLLQMMPLNEEGMFRVSKMVNDHAIPAALSPDVLKRTFDKRWPELKEELDQIVVLDDREKETREPQDILEEILGIVRSPDKPVNQPQTPPLPPIPLRNPTDFFSFGGLKVITLEELSKVNPEMLVKARMISAAKKLDDPVLSEALENGRATHSEKYITTIDFSPFHRASFQEVKASPHRESLKKAGSPFSVRLVCEDSVFEL